MDLRPHPAGSLFPVHVGRGSLPFYFKGHVPQQPPLVQIGVEFRQLLHNGIIHMSIIQLPQKGIFLIAQARRNPETLPVPIDESGRDAVLVPGGEVAPEHFQQGIPCLIIPRHERMKIRQKFPVRHIIQIVLVFPAAQPDLSVPHAPQPETIVPDIAFGIFIMQVIKAEPGFIRIGHMGTIFHRGHQTVLFKPGAVDREIPALVDGPVPGNGGKKAVFVAEPVVRHEQSGLPCCFGGKSHPRRIENPLIQHLECGMRKCCIAVYFHHGLIRSQRPGRSRPSQAVTLAS